MHIISMQDSNAATSATGPGAGTGGAGSRQEPGTNWMRVSSTVVPVPGRAPLPFLALLYCSSAPLYGPVVLRKLL